MVKELLLQAANESDLCCLMPLHQRRISENDLIFFISSSFRAEPAIIRHSKPDTPYVKT